MSPPMLGHRFDGSQLRYAAVVVGRRQLSHSEADDAQRLTHCMRRRSSEGQRPERVRDKVLGVIHCVSPFDEGSGGPRP